MSQENVEIVRTLLVDDADVVPLIRDDATRTRRRAEIEALFESDCAVAWIAEGQRVIEATGLDDAYRGWLDWLAPWETYHVQIERIIPIGDAVLALARLHGRLTGTEKEVEMIAASVYLLRDSK